jgi:hypothetical protein
MTMPPTFKRCIGDTQSSTRSEIKDTLRRLVEAPVSVGIARTRTLVLATLARMASPQYRLSQNLT